MYRLVFCDMLSRTVRAHTCNLGCGRLLARIGLSLYSLE